jgi:hypothetical protein
MVFYLWSFGFLPCCVVCFVICCCSRWLASEWQQGTDAAERSDRRGGGKGRREPEVAAATVGRTAT